MSKTLDQLLAALDKLTATYNATTPKQRQQGRAQHFKRLACFKPGQLAKGNAKRRMQRLDG